MEKLLTRLRNGVVPYQQAIADCNPQGPKHWIKVRADSGKMTRFISKHEDNPSVTQSYLDTLGSLSGFRKDRLLYGRWVSAEGLVYEKLDRCFISPLDEIPVGNLHGGMDFGWNDPFSALAGSLYYDENGRDILYIFYERYKSKCETHKHAHALNRVFPEGMGVWYADPSRPDSIRDFRRVGLNVQKAKNSIMTGVDAVNARINTGRLLISNRCKSLQQEHGSYVYEKEGEKPIDLDNHACDALRYLIMGIDWRKLAIHQYDEVAEEDIGVA